MRVAAVTGNNHEAEKADAIIERRRKRSTLSASTVAGLTSAGAVTAAAVAHGASSGSSATATVAERRPRPSTRPTASAPVVVDERLEKRRKAREERERERMRKKITASIERGRSPTSPNLPAPATSVPRERPAKRDTTTDVAARMASVGTSKPSRLGGGQQTPTATEAAKERKKRYESVLPKDLSSLLEEQAHGSPMAGTVADGLQSGDAKASGEEGAKMKKSFEEQRVEELSELMLSHYTEDEASDSDDDDDGGAHKAGEKADGPKPQLFQEDLDRQQGEPGDGEDDHAGAEHEHEHDQDMDDDPEGGLWEPAVEEWRLRVCAGVGQGLASLAVRFLPPLELLFFFLLWSHLPYGLQRLRRARRSCCGIWWRRRSPRCCPIRPMCPPRRARRPHLPDSCRRRSPTGQHTARYDPCACA